MSAPPGGPERSVNRRFSAIDVGTNTVLLTIAEERAGRLYPVAERATITRLGQDVDRFRRLGEEPMTRTLGALESYRHLLEDHANPPLRAVCTSAVRDADNGADFLDRARETLGTPLRLVSGAEEARLTFVGALSNLSLVGPITVVDVGGGSTEIIHGRHLSSGGLRVDAAESLDIGSVRLTERHLRTDPPARRELDAIDASVDEELARVTRPITGAQLVGVAGTVTTLAAIHQKMERYDPDRIHGSELSRREIDELSGALGVASAEQRLAIIGLTPGRADVIVAGASIVRRVMAWAASDRIVVSDRGVRWGLLVDLASEVK